MAVRKHIVIMITIFVLLTMLALVGCVGAGGASGDNATIQGIVKLSDLPSGPWDGITISVTGPDNFSNIATNMNGFFSVPNVSKSGTYRVYARRGNYIEAAIDPIVVTTIKTYDIRDYLVGAPSGNILVSMNFGQPVWSY